MGSDLLPSKGCVCVRERESELGWAERERDGITTD